MDNQIYGLTTGQAFSDHGAYDQNQIDANRQFGKVLFEPLGSFSCGRRVIQWRVVSSGEPMHFFMAEVFNVAAIQHKGFAHVDLFSPWR